MAQRWLCRGALHSDIKSLRRHPESAWVGAWEMRLSFHEYIWKWERKRSSGARKEKTSSWLRENTLLHVSGLWLWPHGSESLRPGVSKLAYNPWALEWATGRPLGSQLSCVSEFSGTNETSWESPHQSEVCADHGRCGQPCDQNLVLKMVNLGPRHSQATF